MSEIMFECQRCCEFNNAEEWNEATKEGLANNFGPNEDITELTEELINSKEHLSFTCPNCEESCYVEDKQIKVIKF